MSCDVPLITNKISKIWTTLQNTWVESCTFDPRGTYFALAAVISIVTQRFIVTLLRYDPLQTTLCAKPRDHGCA